MAVRDLSPVSWAAPGQATVDLGLILAALTGTKPMPLDEWVNYYSPSIDITVTTANATFQTIGTLCPAVTTNARFILLIAPRGNTVAWTVKGINGDTGIPVHPNGFFFCALTTAAATWGVVTTAAAIVGMRIIVL